MADGQDQGRQDSTDPEQRAFTGGADMPPEQPDQGAEANEELLREEQGDSAPALNAPKRNDAGDDGSHGDYANLPGYGG